MENRLDPVRQGFQEIPERWYEKLDTKSRMALTAGIYILAMVVYREPLNIENLTPSLLAAGLYLIGSVADRISTGRVLDTNIRIQESGIGDDYIIKEENPLISRVRSSREFYRNPRVWITEGVALPIAALLPAGGIALGVGSIFATMNNLRQARRAIRVAELASAEKTQSSPLPPQQ